jgi:hypothetical protein
VPKGDSHHVRALGSLQFTIGLEKSRLDRLDRYRRKRSVSVYDIAGAITTAEADAMFTLAQEIVEQVHAWLVENHSGLMKK